MKVDDDNQIEEEQIINEEEIVVPRIKLEHPVLQKVTALAISQIEAKDKVAGKVYPREEFVRYFDAIADAKAA